MKKNISKTDEQIFNPIDVVIEKAQKMISHELPIPIEFKDQRPEKIK